MEKISFHTSNVRRVFGWLFFCSSDLTGLDFLSSRPAQMSWRFLHWCWRIFPSSASYLKELSHASVSQFTTGFSEEMPVVTPFQCNMIQPGCHESQWSHDLPRLSFQKPLRGRSEDNKKWLDVKQAVFCTLALVSFRFSSATTAFLWDL